MTMKSGGNREVVGSENGNGKKERKAPFVLAMGDGCKNDDDDCLPPQKSNVAPYYRRFGQAMHEPAPISI
jgi:hypothetical protein